MQYVKPRRQRIFKQKTRHKPIIKQCAQHSTRPYIRSPQLSLTVLNFIIWYNAAIVHNHNLVNISRLHQNIALHTAQYQLF